jgi:hypothetical protein
MSEVDSHFSDTPIFVVKNSDIVSEEGSKLVFLRLLLQLQENSPNVIVMRDVNIQEETDVGDIRMLLNIQCQNMLKMFIYVRQG